jgi:hypothetical protein
MTGKKGVESRRNRNRYQNLVLRGIIKPKEYTDSIEVAIAKAGL